jgi:hypothetical protein
VRPGCHRLLTPFTRLDSDPARARGKDRHIRRYSASGAQRRTIAHVSPLLGQDRVNDLALSGLCSCGPHCSPATRGTARIQRQPSMEAGPAVGRNHGSRLPRGAARSSRHTGRRQSLCPCPGVWALTEFPAVPYLGSSSISIPAVGGDTRSTAHRPRVRIRSQAVECCQSGAYRGERSCGSSCVCRQPLSAIRDAFPVYADSFLFPWTNTDRPIACPTSTFSGRF